MENETQKLYSKNHHRDGKQKHNFEKKNILKHQKLKIGSKVPYLEHHCPKHHGHRGHCKEGLQPQLPQLGAAKLMMTLPSCQTPWEVAIFGTRNHGPKMGQSEQNDIRIKSFDDRKIMDMFESHRIGNDLNSINHSEDLSLRLTAAGGHLLSFSSAASLWSWPDDYYIFHIIVNLLKARPSKSSCINMYIMIKMTVYIHMYTCVICYIINHHHHPHPHPHHTKRNTIGSRTSDTERWGKPCSVAADPSPFWAQKLEDLKRQELQQWQ